MLHRHRSLLTIACPACVCVLLGTCGEVSALSFAPPTESAPASPARESSLQVRDPGAAVDDLAARCAAAADYSAKFSGRVVLVMIDGKVVFDRADNGWSVDRPHPLASGTKSFVGVTAMKAVEDKLLTLDELASDTITEWKTDPQKKRISVRQLITMSSGLDPSDALLGGRGGSRLLGEGAALRQRRLGGDDRPVAKNHFAEAVNAPMEHEPGEKFHYGPSHLFAFGELLERKLKAKSAADPSFTLDTFEKYMHARILDPIRLNVAFMGRDAAGKPNLPGGCLLTAREWAKFGQLVVQHGEWTNPDGTTRRVIGWEFLEQCFQPSQANPTYGLTWWLPNNGDAEATLIADGPMSELAKRRSSTKSPRQAVTLEGAPVTVWMAAGLGKQRLFVIPQYKMVIVRFAEATPAGRAFNDRAFLEPLLVREFNAKP